MNSTTGNPGKTNRKTAIIVGVWLIITAVSGILSAVFTGTTLNDPEYLIKVSANETRIIIGAFFVLLMGLSLAMVSVMMFPIFKKQNEALVLGYVVFRGLFETAIYILMVISWLLLIAVSQEYVNAGVPDDSHLQSLGMIIGLGIDWRNHLSSCRCVGFVRCGTEHLISSAGCPRNGCGNMVDCKRVQIICNRVSV